ncbi:FKBP12-associated-like protein [Cladobotryum mycophilum]|uniref:FKBP12-associated-like protein n=1 Tax=Cladobotryum mycophilum TaxID=491253 RepID=A0ABR0SE81_9HYPO
MPEGEGSQTQVPQPQGSSRGASRNRRGRGRGGRGRGQSDGPSQQTRGQGPSSNNPADVNPTAPAATPTPEPSSSVASARAGRGGRGRRGQRPTERGGASNRAARVPRPGPSRSFGGHLTAAVEESTETASLSADAPEFVPGRPVAKRTDKPRASQTPKQPEVRFPKSTASDLGTRIHEDISNSNYECAVCTDEVLRSSHVWSCNICWTENNKGTFLGDVLDVILSYPMSRGRITAGVERISARSHPALHYRLTRADRHVQNLELPVRTHVLFNVTRGLVHHFIVAERYATDLASARKVRVRDKPVSKFVGKQNCSVTILARIHAMAKLTVCNETAACTSRTTISCPCGLRKQEVRCLASTSNPTPSRPEIKCDDECLRLERNRRLASALNIDPTSHTNDHVPYSDNTLRLFKENLAWGEAQEREFRVFSKSPKEDLLRYKPTPSHQRQFLHALAEDYGLESRSEDIEPHRYVIIRKGHKFVSAPSKTLAQCVKIRESQAAIAATASGSREPTPPPPRSGRASRPRQPGVLCFRYHFSPIGGGAHPSHPHYSSFLTPAAVEQALSGLKPRIAGTIKRLDLADSIILCHVDDNGHISRREGLGKNDASGWSAVAGRAAAKKESAKLEPAAASGSSGRRMLGLRKKVVDSKDKGKPWASRLDGDVEC